MQVIDVHCGAFGDGFDGEWAAGGDGVGIDYQVAIVLTVRVKDWEQVIMEGFIGGAEFAVLGDEFE